MATGFVFCFVCFFIFLTQDGFSNALSAGGMPGKAWTVFLVMMFGVLMDRKNNLVLTNLILQFKESTLVGYGKNNKKPAFKLS